MRLRQAVLDTGRWLRTGMLVHAALAWIAIPGAFAQSFQSHVISDDGVSAVVEFTFDWSQPLQASVDSSGILTWDRDTLKRYAAGFDDTSLILETGGPRLPDVAVTGRDFDEVSVSVGQSAAVDPRPEAEAVGLGVYRKKPVVSLVARAYLLDPDAGRLRRYRRLIVRVTRRSEVAKQGARFAVSDNPHLEVAHSELSGGTVFKVAVREEGIYRIDRELLTELGLSPDGIDPNRVTVLGNGGAPVPAENDAFRYADLVENAVFTRGGGDGSFDENDVVLFFGAGPRGWNYTDDGWEHYVHPFSNENYYFIKIETEAHLERLSIPFQEHPSAVQVSTTRGRYFVDLEEFIWSREHGSGHDWMSRTIREGSSRVVFENVLLPGLRSGEVEMSVRAAIASNPRATVSFESGGASIAQLTAPGITINGSEFPSASAGSITFSRSVQAGQALDLRMMLPNQTNEPEAALDWARVFYEQELSASDNYLRFATRPGLVGEQIVRMAGFTQMPILWDVSRPDAVSAPELSSSGGEYTFFQSSNEGDDPTEFVAFTEAASRPIAVEDVESVGSQDLHGLTAFPDLVIVAPAEFESAAERLADHRRGQGLSVVVSRVSEIYNEYSGGLPDMRAVRDYLKFLYDRAPDENSLLRYALLLGDGHYDFRGLSGQEDVETNWIFPYETEESIITDASFTSDDYFGLLDDDEGAWTYTTFGAVGTERVDVGIGRLPAQSLAEADLMVDKLIRYDDPTTFGPWRSRYVAVADDGPTGLSGTQDDADLHVQNIDQVAELIRGSQYPQIDIDKIYAESYERVFQNGYRIPGAAQEIESVLSGGTLVFNYTGHGGPDGLAQEQIFTREDAEALTNGEKLPLFITATCSFGWWDLESGTSGAEALLRNEQGGAIGLFTTVRLVYTSGDTTSLNAGLNRALNIEMFRPAEDGKARRLGDVMRLTKNTNVGLQGNSRKLNLLGDPSMRLGLPERQLVVESLSGVELSGETAQMKALDLVEIEGFVADAAGAVDPSFNGTANVTVFDVVRRVPLVRQVRMPTPYYNIREDLIWRGEVEVEAGRFTGRFVVPKDISYANDFGRITVYGASADTDALGYTEQFVVGGTSDIPPNDLTGPEMELFLNDTTFVAGGVAPDQSELLVRLFDDSGVNTVGAGVGHEMLLVIDGDEGEAQDISGGFVAERNSYQRGEVRWRLGSTDPGPHTLSVRAWDVLNNSSTSELAFQVSDDEVLSVTNVYNYPNPMNRETRFIFEHNQPSGTPARVQIRIYTLSGRPIRTIDTDEALPGGVLNGSLIQIPWDGRDEDYDRPATGIYLYRLRVEVDHPGGETQTSEHVEKLAIIR